MTSKQAYRPVRDPVHADIALSGFSTFFRSAQAREIGVLKGFNFNVFNLWKQTAGCLRETTKPAEKTIRHLEKTTKPAEKITKHLVVPSPGLFFGAKGQKKTGEALYEQEVLGLALQRYNIFERKANRPICILTFRGAVAHSCRLLPFVEFFRSISRRPFGRAWGMSYF